MIIRVESLDSMFEHDVQLKLISFEGKCHKCERDVEIQITKTAGGYGLLGGVLCESNLNGFQLLCSSCFQKTANQFDEQDNSIKNITL